MTQLREMMVDEMTLRGFSPRTHKSYLAAVRDLVRIPVNVNTDSGRT